MKHQKQFTPGDFIILILMLIATAFGITSLVNEADGNEFTVTAYVATGKLTASGVMPVAGVTIAAPRKYPFGTKIFIPGIGLRTVQDRLSMKCDTRIDVFMGSKQEAIRFGKKTLKVKIYE